MTEMPHRYNPGFMIWDMKITVTAMGVGILYIVSSLVLYNESKASDSRTRPFRSTATGFSEHTTMTLIVSV